MEWSWEEVLGGGFEVPGEEVSGPGERISVSWGRGLGEGFGTNLEGANVGPASGNTLFTGGGPPPGH